MTQQLPGAGEIRRDAVYTVGEFCRRTKISHDTIRKYIKPRRIAGKAYVVGREFCDLVEAQPDRLPHEIMDDGRTDAAISFPSPPGCLPR